MQNLGWKIYITEDGLLSAEQVDGCQVGRQKNKTHRSVSMKYLLIFAFS